MTSHHIGALIERARIAAGLSQRALADAAGMSQPTLTLRLIEAFTPPPPRPAPELAALTAREREVLVCLARGATNEDIGRMLFIGEATVKTYVSRVLLKLGVTTRTQAVVPAYDSGLVTPGR
ncbi:LuxR C-terminal-related transcriptional regulator [Actinoplanes sp. TRM 88003]|uniref:LuxR C-terminal-related transcriptional regulator n=1 Tax=Paractinoplanes aksuensis TaxID=2939490 RepID=A0ABT1DMA7_9ACTN|nr:LuxR C-terminal-related transcriptional regulator [Actinoplanes aksuensis]MCO8271180.1 LuxR C-terminal-related transcriptional regulator [Actinoplanes aksuensis]